VERFSAISPHVDLLKETSYLVFLIDRKYNDPPSKKKTKRILIVNKHHQQIIGEILWFGRWRQYCFFPANYTTTVWNTTCLEDVQSVIKELMDERKKK
jgi:hypothetical protein